MRKYILLVVIVLFTNNSLAQIQIGDLYYYLTGTSARVAFKGYGFYNSDAYMIPSKVTYNGLDYTVTEIGLSHHQLVSLILRILSVIVIYYV